MAAVAALWYILWSPSNVSPAMKLQITLKDSYLPPTSCGSFCIIFLWLVLQRRSSTHASHRGNGLPIRTTLIYGNHALMTDVRWQESAWDSLKSVFNNMVKLWWRAMKFFTSGHGQSIYITSEILWQCIQWPWSRTKMMVMMMMKMKDSCHVDAARLSIYQGAGGGGELINGTNHLQ